MWTKKRAGWWCFLAWDVNGNAVRCQWKFWRSDWILLMHLASNFWSFQVKFSKAVFNRIAQIRLHNWDPYSRRIRTWSCGSQVLAPCVVFPGPISQRLSDNKNVIRRNVRFSKNASPFNRPFVLYQFLMEIGLIKRNFQVSCAHLKFSVYQQKSFTNRSFTKGIYQGFW